MLLPFDPRIAGSLSCLCLLVTTTLSGCSRNGFLPPVPESLRGFGWQLPPQLEHTPSSAATETYAAIDENEFQEALSKPQSTFAIDVDTAAYANVRRMLKSGHLPPPNAVRIEELVNYFQYDYPTPTDEHPFAVTTEVAACPWNPKHELLRVALQGVELEQAERPACNLVFLLDVSGSMTNSNKLPLVQSALRMLVDNLQPQDRVAIVVYAGASGLVLDSTPATQAKKIIESLERLKSGGASNGGAGIQLAYQVASENQIDGGVNRVILCTDGDFNVGLTDDQPLVELVSQQAHSGIFLSVLGFGDGNLKDATMEQLADRGNGNYAYIDSLLEARKVLVQQANGTLATIAKDVKIQVDFNPRHVHAYRLLGYENRLLESQDFRDDAKDAGEIGAGHSVTAFYEIVSPEMAGPKPNRQVRAAEFVEHRIEHAADSSLLLTVNLRYKQPDSDAASEFQVRVPAQAVQPAASSDFEFASAVVAYGLLLRGSPYAGNANWDWLIDTAQRNIGADPQGIRAEFVQLARVASELSE